MNKTTFLVLLSCIGIIVILSIVMNFPIVYLCIVIDEIILIDLLSRSIKDIPERKKIGVKEVRIGIEKTLLYSSAMISSILGVFFRFKGEIKRSLITLIISGIFLLIDLFILIFIDKQDSGKLDKIRQNPSGL